MAGERILVVEDEESHSRLIQQRLQEFGYEVTGAARSAEDALLLTEASLPDLVLMDIELGGVMDGVEAARVIRERWNVPVVFLTGCVDDSVLRRAQITEPFGLLLKPFEDRQLQTNIELALYKHRAEKKLKQVEHWFTTTIRSMADAVIVTDPFGIVILINSVAEQLTGWAQAEAGGRRLEDVFRLAGPETKETSLITRALRGRIVPALAAGQAWLETRTGDPLPIEGNAAAIQDVQGTAIGVVLIFRDITRRKAAEEALHHSREQLRALSDRLQLVREEERTRISREIHDQLGQALTSLKLDLIWLAKRLTGTQTLLLEKTKAMAAMIDSTIQTVRKISSDLRPSLLDDLGLVAAIEWEAEQFQQRTGIPCQCRAEPPGFEVDSARATAVFRILQEALTNIARHAHASRAEVRFHLRRGDLFLEVSDDGCGVRETERSDSQSLGLLGMRERALMLGGSVHISGAPGTLVSVCIPARPVTTAPASD